MKIAALGRTRWLYDAIMLAAAAGHEIVLIGTCPAAPEYTRGAHDFEALAKSLGCPFFNDTNINDERYVRLARESRAEIGISVNWLTLIGRELIDAFPRGIINAHAGDLPRYRGNACPNWAILNGEPEVVVTLHLMATELDAGPILLKRPIALTDTTYIGDVYRALDRMIPEMFVAVLDGLVAGSITPRPQAADPRESLRCYPRLPRDGEIAWERDAEEIVRLVRASAEPFAGAFTHLDGERLTVWRARSATQVAPYCAVPGQVAWVDRRTGEVAVIAGRDIVIIEEAEGAKRGPAADLIRSARTRLGLEVGKELARLRAELEALRARVQPGAGSLEDGCG